MDQCIMVPVRGMQFMASSPEAGSASEADESLDEAPCCWDSILRAETMLPRKGTPSENAPAITAHIASSTVVVLAMMTSHADGLKFSLYLEGTRWSLLLVRTGTSWRRRARKYSPRNDVANRMRACSLQQRAGFLSCLQSQYRVRIRLAAPCLLYARPIRCMDCTGCAWPLARWPVASDWARSLGVKIADCRGTRYAGTGGAP